MSAAGLDLVVLTAIVVAAILGAVSGALQQAGNLAAALLGWAAARHLGPPVAAGLSHTLPGPVARATAGVLVFFGFYTLAATGLHLLVVRRGRGGAAGSPWDRGLGALLGGAKASLALWALLSALVLVGPMGPKWHAIDPRGSDLAALTREHNLFAGIRSPIFDWLRHLLRAPRDPASDLWTILPRAPVNGATRAPPRDRTASTAFSRMARRC